jgi:hypothetical protein
VATTTDYYRKLLDGTLDETARAIEEADLQTVAESRARVPAVGS